MSSCCVRLRSYSRWSASSFACCNLWRADLRRLRTRRAKAMRSTSTRRNPATKLSAEETTLIAAACAGGTSATKRATMQTQARLTLFAQSREGDNSCLRGASGAFCSPFRPSRLPQAAVIRVTCGGDVVRRYGVASAFDVTDDCANDLSGRCENHDVGVGSYGKRAFLFFDAEYLRGIDGRHPNCVL